MAVPDFQVFMLPLLKHVADGQEYGVPTTAEALANTLGLTEADRRETLPNSAQSRLKNRVSWAFLYLHRAGLLDRVSRGKHRITQLGRDVLSDPPARIDKEYLRRFPSFEEFISLRTIGGVDSATERADSDATATPEESLQASYERLRRALAVELLDRVRRCSPAFFESLVVDLLVAMGYGGSRADAGQAVGRSGDGGVDGVIKEDKLGLDVVLIQAKRWESPVGASTVRDFAGSLEGQRARKGVLITTSRFTQDATDYVARIEKKIVLINGEQLAELMIDHDVGVTATSRFVIKKVDSDFFDEE